MASAKGHLIFITNTKRYMYDLHRDIRFIDTSDFMVAGEEAADRLHQGRRCGEQR